MSVLTGSPYQVGHVIKVKNKPFISKKKTEFPQIIPGGDYSFFRTKRGDYFTRSRALNILCYYPTAL